MKCPFPGMDPYLEYGVWPDFHHGLIFCARTALNDLVRPRYVAVAEERLVVVEHARDIQPDVTVLQDPEILAGRAATAVLDADPALVLEANRSSDLMRQPYLQIIDPKAGRKVITTIEVVSPDNKVGKGLAAFRAKQDECWEAGVNVVEIDLLKGGGSILKPEFARKIQRDDAPYIIAVSRCSPPRYEVYRIGLKTRLPRVAVPLAPDDKDVVLDVQAAFAAAWAAGPYADLNPYNDPLPGSSSDVDREWCRTQLAEAGLIPAN